MRVNCRYIVIKPVPGFAVGAELIYLGTSVSLDRYMGEQYTMHHFLEGDIRIYEYEETLDELRTQPQIYFQFLEDVDINREFELLKQQDPEKYKPRPRPYIP